MKDLRIRRYEFFNSKGKLVTEYYYIQEHKQNWLGLYRWKDITHLQCGMGDCYKSRTTFDTLEKALDFAENVLCKNTPYDTSVESTVDDYYCCNETFNTKEK